MLKLSEFHHNHHPSGVKMLAKFIRRGIRVKGRRVKRKRSDWISVNVPAIIDRSTFKAAQVRRQLNLEVRRRQGKRFYMLSGMVFCSDCGRSYVAQTHNTNRNGKKSSTAHYRERADRGGCRNQQLSGRYLEPMVWEQVRDALINPENLLKGYETTVKQNNYARLKTRDRIDRLQLEYDKAQTKLDNLTDAYMDPDISMPKSEYLRQRDRIVKKLSSLQEQVIAFQDKYSQHHVPLELETIVEFTRAIKHRLESDDYITPKDKRAILDSLQIKVHIDGHRKLVIEGFLGMSNDGLLSQQW